MLADFSLHPSYVQIFSDIKVRHSYNRHGITIPVPSITMLRNKTLLSLLITSSREENTIFIHPFVPAVGNNAVKSGSAKLM